MGLLVDGVWQDKWYETKTTGGKFKRQDSQFRNWLTADGEAGPSGTGGFKAECNRYHLYVSLACPWAHRTLIYRRLKGLEEIISLSVVDPFMGKNGWQFSNGEGCIPDTINHADFAHQVYTAADPHYTGRVTVPILWDKNQNTVVSNESSEIIRMFNSAFNAITGNNQDFYPEGLRSEIDSVNDTVYSNINNGVYKAGFATTQEAYEEAVRALFETLDTLDARLEDRRYLTGNSITEADWRLFPTLVRFDPVYVGHFKCNLKRIVDYRNLSGYLRDLYQQPGIADTVNMVHIKNHYYGSHDTVNPTRIVPVGPELDLERSHDRDRFS